MADAMRQIVLDTETTGIDPKEGHRIVEIGAVELENRSLTGRTFHQYLNPDRHMDDEVIRIHGITNEFVQDKPRFHDIVSDFMNFISGAELIIHNAPFDLSHLNAELDRLPSNPWHKIQDHAHITDSLVMARKRYAGQRNSLDALCKRLGVDNSGRTFHGALLDSEILADVYLAMTGGQTTLGWEGNGGIDDEVLTVQHTIEAERSANIAAFQVDDETLKKHLDMLERMQKKSCVWTQLFPHTLPSAS